MKAAEIWLKYGRDLNVREAEHALAGIDAEMARLRAERDVVRAALKDMVAEADKLRADKDALLAALKAWMADYDIAGQISGPAWEAAMATIKAAEEGK